jgi:hypothetical protein
MLGAAQHRTGLLRTQRPALPGAVTVPRGREAAATAAPPRGGRRPRTIRAPAQPSPAGVLTAGGAPAAQFLEIMTMSREREAEEAAGGSRPRSAAAGAGAHGAWGGAPPGGAGRGGAKAGGGPVPLPLDLMMLGYKRKKLVDGARPSILYPIPAPRMRRAAPAAPARAGRLVHVAPGIALRRWCCRAVRADAACHPARRPQA